MLFTPAMASAFGDWLEREQIRDALVNARPELAELVTLDQQRPLLRIALPAGGSVIVARMAAVEPAPWVVGVVGVVGLVGAAEVAAVSAPALHEVRTADEVTALVLDLVAPRDSARSGAATAGAGAREPGA